MSNEQKIKMKLGQLNFSFFKWIIISIRSLIFISVLMTNVFYHYFLDLISSLFPFIIMKRYLISLLNLIMNRILLLILGYYEFQTENFAFFNRLQNKLTLKSGFIGIGDHKNIIDFFYYSYIFNPVFVKIIIYAQTIVQNVYYAPLRYNQALQCALLTRGFDPIIIRNQKEWKKIKYRKMNMKTLVSECFEQLKGGIIILIPGIQMNQHIMLQQKIALDIYQNQERFLRSGVGFKITFDNREIFQKRFKNQIYFILTLMSQIKINHLNIKSLIFRNFRNTYTKNTYKDFIDQNLYRQGENIKKISYIQYVYQQNQKDEKLNQQPYLKKQL